MVIKIQQRTFDDAVQENIEILGMNPEEAIQEAINQFKAQDADLSDIVTEYVSESNLDSVSKEIEKLNEKDSNIEYLIDQLSKINVECDKGIKYRITAANSGLYNKILNIYDKYNNNDEIKAACLKSMVCLMTKQPDLLDDKGIEIISRNLLEDDEKILILTQKWVKECCTMHEKNRQSMFGINIVQKLKPHLDTNNPILLREILIVLRFLMLDDDVRVEFGKAHEHACIIAKETLNHFIGLLQKFKSNENIVNDLFLTLAALLVRSEFCKQIEDAGGLDMIYQVMEDYSENEKLIRQCFKLIKALAGNDECKAHIIAKNFAPLISKAMNHHQNSSGTSALGLGCVAALCLRNPSNSQAFFDAQVPEIIIGIMKKHPNDRFVQKTASWAVRNMVSRSRHQNVHFLNQGIEEILKDNLKKFPDIEYDTKAALRDLDCKVEFKEEWTGKGGKITTGATSFDTE